MIKVDYIVYESAPSWCHKVFDTYEEFTNWRKECLELFGKLPCEFYIYHKWDEDLNASERVSKPADETKVSVGDGVTEFGWSDRHPYEVIDVKSKSTIVVRKLKTRRTDNNGMSDCQSYDYYRDFGGVTKTLRKVKRGKRYVWIEWGTHQSTNGRNTFIVGYAHRYYDYSF